MDELTPTTKIAPSPVPPDAIASLCRLSEQMILTQGALPELREAIVERFLAHEALTRLHMASMSDSKTVMIQLSVDTKDTIHMMSRLKDAIEELTAALDRIQR